MEKRVKNYGATPQEWEFFSHTLEQSKYLLPVVSNPDATISPHSKVKSLGKTPTRYNPKREVVGIPDWTKHETSEHDLEKWAKEPDYGICLRGVEYKAIDADVTDRAQADQIERKVREYFASMGVTNVPVRWREDSCKILIPVRVVTSGGIAADMPKRVMHTGEGIIELLGDKQQYIVAGTHPGGHRYEWEDLEGGIPTITLDGFDTLWKLLEQTFAVKPARTERRAVSPTVDTDEPLFKALTDNGMVLSEGENGSYNIICPFSEEHTTESADSATRYWPPHTGGYATASVKCLHAHCAHRTTDDYSQKLGVSDTDSVCFEDVTGLLERKRKKYEPIPAIEYMHNAKQPEWLVKKVLPANSITMVYGAPGSGKTFTVFDLCASIARGQPWRGRKTKQGKVVYVCAEGAYFFKNRIDAYARHHGLTQTSDLPIGVVDDKIDLLKDADVTDFIESLRGDTSLNLVVLDTFARCMSGDENSAQDASKVLGNCERIKDELGVAVVLVHHSGKDSSRGARGSSSIRAGVDCEAEVANDNGLRALKIRKQKDGPDDDSYPFALRDVILGEDDEGDAITSCIVEEAEYGPIVTQVTSTSDKKYTDAQTKVYNAVIDYHDDLGEWPLQDTVAEIIVEETGRKASSVKRSITELVERRVLDLNDDDRVSVHVDETTFDDLTEPP